MNKQLPPACIDAEEAILGGIIFDPKAILVIKDILPAEAFYVGAHQTIYAAMLDLNLKNKDTDFISLSTYLDDREQLERAGGTTKLAQLLARTISAVNIDRYALLVIDKWRRRQLITAGHNIIDFGYDQTVELFQHYKKIAEILPSSITGKTQTKKLFTVNTVKYTMTSKSSNEQIELEITVEDGASLADAIKDLRSQCEATAKELWGQDQ